MKIDNMREEHSERVSMEEEKRRAEEQEAAFQEMKYRNKPAAEETPAEPVELKKYGFIAVSVGDAMEETEKSLGIDYVISGGQTMNPSTEDILSAVEKVNAENVFVFPNNKNIILAANQAAAICEDKKIHVIPTKSVPQGISAVLSFAEDMSPEENIEAMTEAISAVKSGEVTYAVRDTSVDGKEIKNGDIMGISDKGIDVVGTSVDEVTTSLIEGMVDEDSGLITLYYGSDVSKEDAEKLCDALTEKFDELEVELHEGGQPIYYYIVSVE